MSRQFGKYRIENEDRDLLRRSASGNVFRAYDSTSSHPFPLAIQVLSRVQDPAVRQRVELGSRTALALNHPNIIRVFEFQWQDEIPFLVMELLKGESLDRAVKSGKAGGEPLRLHEKVDLLLQIAKGVEHAHSAGIVCRELKPANIQLLPDRTVKLMDLGATPLVDEEGQWRNRQGEIAGTLLYLAPEQLAGGSADARTDIFAFGVICYELLSGKHPFAGPDSGAVIHNLTCFDPPALSSLVAECPEALNALVASLLIKDRGRRPVRMDEVVQGLLSIRQRLRAERAGLLAGQIQPLIEAGETKLARETIHSVLELQPENAEARIWREYLTAQTPGETAATGASVRDPIPETANRQAEVARERAELLASHRLAIEEALSAGDWSGARSKLDEALGLFPDEPTLAEFPPRIQAAERQAALARLQAEIAASFASMDLLQAETQLSSTREMFFGDPTWHRLWQELEIRRAYQDGLAAARHSIDSCDLSAAREILGALLTDAPDRRAAELLTAVGEMERKRPAQDVPPVRTPEAAPTRLAPEESPVVQGREGVAKLALCRDYHGAIHLLQQLEAESLPAGGAATNRAAAQSPEERLRLALETVSARRKQGTDGSGNLHMDATPELAAKLVREGDFRGAMEVLRRLERGAITPDGVHPGATVPPPDRSAEERARNALFMHSAKDAPAGFGPAGGKSPLGHLPQPRSLPLPPERVRTLVMLGSGLGVGLLIVAILWWYLPVQIVPVPAALTFHQEFGRVSDAQTVSWEPKGLDFGVAAKPVWLQATKTPNGVRVAIAKAGLNPGAHAGTVSIDFRSGRIRNRQITIPVTADVTIGAVPSRLAFTYRRGGSAPATQFAIVAGANILTATSTAKWLNAVVTKAGENAAVRISVAPGALPVGEHQAEVRLKDSSEAECLLTVNLTVTNSRSQ